MKKYTLLQAIIGLAATAATVYVVAFYAGKGYSRSTAGNKLL
jgi:hypothetical protein